MGSMFQSPRGDFGFLKSRGMAKTGPRDRRVSIPSRGFWFFEAKTRLADRVVGSISFQSPRGDFGFLKNTVIGSLESYNG